MILLLAALALAASQATPDAAPTATPQPAALSADTPIERIVADARGKAALDEVLPGLTGHPMYESFKQMSPRQVAPFSEGKVTDEALTRLDAKLKALKPAG